MNEKIMDLLGKIIENQTETNSHLKELTSRIQKVEMNVENDLSYKIKALFDAREIQNDKIDVINKSLERIEVKIETLQLETVHVRKAK